MNKEDFEALKVGDRIHLQPGREWEVVATGSSGGERELAIRNPDGELDIAASCDALIWDKVVPFFKVGKTYAMAPGTYRYEVTALHVAKDRSIWAIAEFQTFSNDGIGLVTLNSGDFKSMKEVE